MTRPPWHVIFDIYSDPLLTVGMVDEISVRGSTPPQQSSQSPTFELLVHLAGHPRRFTVPKLGRGLIDGGFEEAACCLDYVEDDGTVPQDCGESTPRHSRRNSNCSEVTVPIPPDPPSQHTTSPWDPARVAKNLAQRYPSTAPSAKENALLQLVQGTERFFRRNGQQRPRKVWSRQREIIGSQSDLLNNASDSEPDDLDEIHGAPNPTYDDYPFRTPGMCNHIHSYEQYIAYSNRSLMRITMFLEFETTEMHRVCIVCSNEGDQLCQPAHQSLKKHTPKLEEAQTKA